MRSPGTQWTCYLNDRKYSFAELYDFCRIKSGSKIINYLKISNKQIANHSTPVQHFNDVNFGHLCDDYLNRKLKGMDPENFISSLYSNLHGRRIRIEIICFSQKF